ncbi:MAG: MmcQ/YjbR family DNA-binding protein [Alphaproteobacteria bacterium]|nr:MmcQ/YjbR family DNA-binding protein [Alphaproteobacteria bacterium]MBU1514414.1 MmcQ/YjbR family DNA-binding protein [Alphaproteobacteria bacterium]MBU2096058.1 MmcQ/YjbR family DNA-binding protein [Alphaproteobacteria bacterium]MBU2150100.1 MmcQ/YjbR family DNA-binding protein [Alphaproteobacteria bacterium]MBU2308613.1 MmcQ/YjbR family DNA-binding protein [Alphaproteobacteria bacterium]
MTPVEIETFAMALPDATKITLWRRQDVYKVRGKVFAICETDSLSFKATGIAYAVLVQDGPGRPAPGFVPGHWVNMPLSEVAPDDAADWIATSYRLAAAGLSKTARAELGIG